MDDLTQYHERCSKLWGLRRYVSEASNTARDDLGTEAIQERNNGRCRVVGIASTKKENVVVAGEPRPILHIQIGTYIDVCCMWYSKI
jgi:hypothetical protein